MEAENAELKVALGEVAAELRAWRERGAWLQTFSPRADPRGGKIPTVRWCPAGNPPGDLASAAAPGSERGRPAAMMRADGHTVSESSVFRSLARRG